MKELYKIFQKHSIVCTDSRNCPKDSIFFALKGENFDANKFALSALEKGCSYAVIDDEKYKTDERFILVDDVLETLQKLATYHRKQLKTRIIGITGTNGKTTTKELIARVLGEKYNVHYTQGNFNNHIGVPLTLLQLTDKHEIAVVEMGANHPEEIRFLAEIVSPDFGIITNVGKAHLEGFGSFDGVMKTKRELYENVNSNGGKIFINTGNSFLTTMSKRAGFRLPNTVLSYELNCELSKHIAVGRVTGNTPTLQMKCKTSRGEFSVSTNLIGTYNAENVLAAVAIGTYFDVDNDAIKKSLEAYQPTNNRSQLKETKRNHLIVDAYNANPTSMTAAINNFIKMEVENKMLILGDMLELGTAAKQEHQKVVDLLVKKEQKNVMLVGSCFAQTTNPFLTFKNVDELNEYLTKNKFKGNYILIKGSHGIHLENTIEKL